MHQNWTTLNFFLNAHQVIDTVYDLNLDLVGWHGKTDESLDSNQNLVLAQSLYPTQRTKLEYYVFSNCNCCTPTTFNYCTKGQLNSEWIYEVIVSPKMSTKKFKDFCPGS